MEITRQNVRVIRSELESLLPQIEKLTGLHVEIGNAIFNPGNNVIFKLVLSQKDGDQVKTPEVTNFNELCELYGLQKSDLGKVFTYNKSSYKIVGLSARRSKYPILVERQPDGKSFKLGIVMVLMGLGRQVPQNMIRYGN